MMIWERDQLIALQGIAQELRRLNDNLEKKVVPTAEQMVTVSKSISETLPSLAYSIRSKS